MMIVDGFTLIDYIKSSIEILMNMKMDDGGAGNVKNTEYTEDDDTEQRS